MTIGGVEINDRAREIMLTAGLSLERELGRKLTDSEMDAVIMATVRRLAEPTAPTTRLQ